MDNVEDSILDEQLSMRRRLTIVTAEDNVPSDEENGDNIELLDGDDGTDFILSQVILMQFDNYSDAYESDEEEYDEEDEEEDEEEEEAIIEEYKEELKEKIKKGLESRTDSIEKKAVAPQTFEEMASMYRPKSSENSGIAANVTNIESIKPEVKEEIVPKKIEEIQSEKNLKESQQVNIETSGKNDGSENVNVKEEIHVGKQKDSKLDENVEVDNAEYDEEDDGEDEELEPDDEDIGADDERGYMDDEADESQEDDEYIDEDHEDISDDDVDDSDLMKRLDSKYGKLPEKRSGRNNDSGSDESDASDGKEWTSKFWK